MFTKRTMAMATAMLAVSASAVLAGTKYQANLVPATVTNPTMASGKVQLKDTADIKAKIKGVTDGAGDPVTGVDDDTVIDGTEYVVILKATFTALNITIEAPIVMDLKNGGGKGAVSLGGLIGLIPPGVTRAVEVVGGEVWGPVGPANAAACQADVTAGYAAPPSACKQGTKIGVAGIYVP